MADTPFNPTNSPLDEEIEKIIKDTEKKSLFNNWEVYFKVRKPNDVDIKGNNKGDYIDPEEEEDIYRPFKVLDIDIEENFDSGASKKISMHCVFLMGMFYKIIQPYKDYLECVLTKKPLTSHLGNDTYQMVDPDGEEETFTYYVVLPDDPAFMGKTTNTDQFLRIDLDNRGFVDATIQLVELPFEKLKPVCIGGIYRRSTLEDVVKMEMKKQSDKHPLSDGPSVETFNIFPFDNKKVHEQVIIPQGLPLMELVPYLHRFHQGVYSAGANTYLQGKDLWIYPPYRVTRVAEEEKTLTIVKVPPNVMTEAECTWRKEGERFIVMASSDTNFKDLSRNQYFNKGNGTRFSDARQYITNEHGKKSGNKVKINRKENMQEYVMEEMEGRNTVFTSQDEIHSNVIYENAKLARQAGSAVTFHWKNSDHLIFYPGMPVTVLYLSEEKQVEAMYGVLMGTASHLGVNGQGPQTKTWRSDTGLNVFLKAQTFDEGSE